MKKTGLSFCVGGVRTPSGISAVSWFVLIAAASVDPLRSGRIISVRTHTGRRASILLSVSVTPVQCTISSPCSSQDFLMIFRNTIEGSATYTIGRCGVLASMAFFPGHVIVLLSCLNVQVTFCVLLIIGIVCG